MKYTNLLRFLLTAFLLAALSATNLQAVEKVTYFHFDAGGSPVAASDAAGALLWKEDYKPYGERLRNSDDGSNIQWFSGKPQDTDTGLSYYGARYYNPEIGRFMGVDPAMFDESNLHSFNRYAYANNNPYRYTDPDGESPLDLIFLAVDSAKLASAIASGVGIQAAALDFGASLVGVLSPVPGTGQVIKATRVASKSGKVLGAVTKKGDTILYQKVGPKGEHLKFGITKNPETRYTKEQLGGGRLKVIASGDKKEMLSLERKLHEKLPIGPEEGQKFYIRKQVEQGLKPPPYGN